MSKNVEQNYLDEINTNYTMHDKDININLYRGKRIAEKVTGKEILELGCADGMLSKILSGRFDNLICVDASKIHTDAVKKLVPSATVITSLFEDLNFEKKFDTIIVGHVLEHVSNPIETLRNLLKFCHKKTTVIITVPNGNSIHRLIGAKLGMIPYPQFLTSNDLKIGHRRVYTLQELKSDIENAGFDAALEEGIAIKPFSNTQMNEWGADLREAFFDISEFLPPEICGELMIVARPKP